MSKEVKSMKTHFQLIALLLISGILGLQNPLVAKNIPIAQTWELELPVGEFVVLDFPFDIDVRTTPFQRTEMRKISDAQESQDLKLGLPPVSNTTTEASPNTQAQALNLPTPSSQATAKPSENQATAQASSLQKASAQTTSTLSLKKGTRTIELFAKRTGETKAVIWGYEEHPIMLTLKFVEEEGASLDKFYRFTAPESKRAEASNFESQPHVDVVSRLTYALYNQLTPKGYRKIANTQIFTYPELNIQLRLVYTLAGNQYVGEYWEVTNLSSTELKLNEQIFHEEGVFSVSLLQNHISSNGTTPMYITRRAH